MLLMLYMIYKFLGKKDGNTDSSMGKLNGMVALSIAINGWDVGWTMFFMRSLREESGSDTIRGTLT